jgi:hypothetical protein
MKYKIIKNEALVSENKDPGIENLGLKIGDEFEGVKIASNAVVGKIGDNAQVIYLWNLEEVPRQEK